MNLVLTACDLHVTLNWPIASFQGFEPGTRKIQSDFLAGKDSSIRENPSVFIGNHGVVENNVPFMTDEGVICARYLCSAMYNYVHKENKLWRGKLKYGICEL